MQNPSRPRFSYGRCGRLLLIASCAQLVFFSAGAMAQSPAPDTIALVQLELQGGDTPPKADLSGALRRGLARAGLKVSGQAPADDAARCVEADCLKQLGARFQAALLAFAQVQTSSQKYEVQVRVVSAASGETLSTDTVSCGLEDLCPPMPQTLQRLAKEAGRKTRARLAEVPVAAAPEPAAEAPVQMTFAPPRVYDVAAPETTQTGTPAWVPWVLASAGGASMLTGGVLLAMNNTCSSDAMACEPRNLALAGWALSGVGLVAVATASALWFLEAQEASETSGVALSPWVQSQSAGVSLAGRWR